MKRTRKSAPKEHGSPLASIGVSSQEEKIYTILLSFDTDVVDRIFADGFDGASP